MAGERVTVSGVGVFDSDQIAKASPSYGLRDDPPTLTLTLRDRGRTIEAAPGLDAAGPTLLGDVIVAEYGGTLWRAVSLTGGADPVIVLRHHIADSLIRRYGPLSAKKGTSRAQWNRGLLSLNGRAPWRVVCPEADGSRPPVLSAGDVLRDRSVQRTRDAQRAPGFAPGASFRVAGRTASEAQKRVLAAALSVADDESANGKDREALVCALIVESRAQNLAYGDASSTGPLQVLAGTARAVGVNPRSTEQVCREFLRNGYWRYRPDGAIALARKHPSWTAGQIAQACQGSAHPERYDAARKEARAIIAAWSGGNTTGTTGEENRSTFSLDENTTYWAHTGTSAGEVNRARFIGQDKLGDALYWVAETLLARSRPYATISPWDSAVILSPPRFDEARSVDALTAQLAMPRTLCGQLIGRNLSVVGYRGQDGHYLVTKAARSGRGDRWVQVELERPRNPLKKAATTSSIGASSASSTTRTAASASSVDAADVAVARITTDGGAKGIVDQIADLAKRVGGASIYVGSDYRPGSTTSSGNVSDHASNNATRAARDIGKRGTNLITGPPSPEMDRAVVAIGKALGRTYKLGAVVIDTFQWNGFRVQLLWRTPKYGGHMGHLHAGVSRIGATRDANNSGRTDNGTPYLRRPF